MASRVFGKYDCLKVMPKYANKPVGIDKFMKMFEDAAQLADFLDVEPNTLNRQFKGNVQEFYKSQALHWRELYINKEEAFEEATEIYIEHSKTLQAKFEIIKDDLDWEIEKKQDQIEDLTEKILELSL
jgi:hypothetical protein